VPFFIFEFLWIFALSPLGLLKFTYYFGDDPASSMCFRDIWSQSTCVIIFLPYCACAILYFEISLNFRLNSFGSLKIHILFGDTCTNSMFFRDIWSQSSCVIICHSFLLELIWIFVLSPSTLSIFLLLFEYLAIPWCVFRLISFESICAILLIVISLNFDLQLTLSVLLLFLGLQNWYHCLLCLIVMMPFFFLRFLRIFVLRPLGLSDFISYPGVHSPSLMCFRVNLFRYVYQLWYDL